ncbi:MAG: TonB-dependent receptor plug domain-containing protein, partial [Bacteroidales bacterium]|nr:TonB-dependent receptor plug domain-containing protein [Bacteroidales bacterium]
MKKCVYFAAAFLFAALSAGTAGAQSRVETIDKVTVSATRVPVALHSSARIVTLMDSLTIASAPAETVNDLLKYALGVDVRQRGAMGMQTDISIRGGTYNQVAVLLDGINITDPQTGHNSFD